MSKLLIDLEDYERLSGIARDDMPHEIKRANDGKRCAYCGAEKPFTKDHIIPRSRGGTDDASNLVWCCVSCNSKKGTRTPGEAGMPIIYVEESKAS